MPVGIWAVLGVVCLLVGLPLSIAFPLGIYLLLAGTVFLIIAAVEWLRERAGSRAAGGLDEDDDLDDDASSDT